MSSADLETLLLEAMLACDASPTLAKIHAANFAAMLRPKIARERRDRVIRDMLPRAGAEATAECLGICRATVYNAVRKSKKAKAA